MMRVRLYWWLRGIAIASAITLYTDSTFAQTSSYYGGGITRIDILTPTVDVSSQIYNVCNPGNPKFSSSFIITGRGGLPISPYLALQEQNTYSTWVRFKTKPESNTVRINKPDLIATSAPTIREASSWIADKSGNIQLVAPASQASQTPHIPSQPNLCSAP